MVLPIVLGIVALFVVFVAVLLIRMAMFRPKAEENRVKEEITFDEEAAVHNLGELIKCKTVSFYDHTKEDDAEFEKLVSKLPELYPHVMKTCTLQRFDGRALLFKWEGKERTGNPSVLMAHYDVVPVNEDQWTVPAFDALIKDGKMWGRGTLDTKVTFNGVMSAAENLMGQGFQPKNDIYFAFSGGEEINGEGAVNIVDYFEEQGIQIEMVIDEGGAVVQDIFPGVKAPCGLIGIAEKGMMNLEFTVHSGGGHASAPKPHTPVGKLSMACAKVEANPFKFHLTKPVLEMFDTLGRRSTFVYRLIFANLWCFGGLLDKICKKGGGELNALVRTTVAFTQMQGSQAPNVIPPVASMVANLRLNPMDSVEGAQKYIASVVDDADVTYSISSSMEPSPISRTDVEGWKRVASAVADTWDGCLVAPYLMMQCSDSRHYGRISDRVYRFSAMDLTADERRTIHGNDEHIRLETIKRAVEFYIRVMKQC